MNTIIQALEYHASTRPEKTAISGSDSGNLSWQQLYSEATVMIPALAGCRTIGLYMGNSPAWIVADLAAMAIGIMSVPLPTFFSTTQLRHAIQNAQIDTLITDDPQRIATLVEIGRELKINIAGKLYTQLFLYRNNGGSRNGATAKLTYTSGTTGTPRGVRLGLPAIEQVTASLADAAEARADDRTLVVLPLSILLENIGSVYVPIIAGAEIIVPDATELGISGSSRVDAKQFAKALNRFRPTTMIVPPHLLKLIVALGQQHKLPDSFRFIAVGGAPTGNTLLNAAQTLGLPVFQGYGLSEACSVIAVNSPADNRPGSVGKPLPHTHVRVSDDGRVYVGGIISDGYLNETDFGDGTELDTGDLGYLDDDGYLYITGRHHNRVVTDYGRNISPEWVESELLSHPAISQAMVFGKENGELAAVLLPRDTVTPEHLRAALHDTNTRLPDYARISRYALADSPFSIATGELTAAGILARKVIEQRYASLTNTLPEGNT
ncbi:MAG TPA: long-chain acyl-CoA synthetase [Gammaproteobacteria bacterium]|nr:long-chain acyl-CoA synthetase [Gammaproteobacteria bacterium]